MAEMPDAVKVQRKLKTGRPPKITPELVRNIALMIATGAPMYTVAAANGVHRDTINDWLRKGAVAKRGVYFEFSATVKQAAAQGMLKHFDNIRESADGYAVIHKRVTQRKNKETGQMETVEQTVEESLDRNWTASAWILERLNPELFGRRDMNVKVSGGDRPIEIDVQQAKSVYEDPEKLAEFLAALVEASLIPAIEVSALPMPTNGNGNGKLGG